VTADDKPDVGAALAAPFPAADVKWKPQSVKGNRALAMAYIDARLVMDRLDAVAGLGNWADKYTLLPDGSVMCDLSVRLDGEWITKADVGSLSEQPDGGDRLKAAFSDALKRAAVKFGIGRYLYRLQAQWADYDPVKKQFTDRPQLPFWAIPESDRQKGQVAAKGGKKASPAADPAEGLSPHVAGLVRTFETCPTLDEYAVAEMEMQRLWVDKATTNRERAAMKAASEASYDRVSASDGGTPF
jgi:hypothetical protein